MGSATVSLDSAFMIYYMPSIATILLLNQDFDPLKCPVDRQTDHTTVTSTAIAAIGICKICC